MNKFLPVFKNQKGAAHLFLLFAAIAIIAFLGFSSLAPFKDQLFSTLNRKPDSFASETRTEYLVKPYLVYPSDKQKYPEYETAVSNYMVELRNWYQAKVGKTFEMAPLQVVTAPEDYLTIRCGGTPSQECINDPARLEGNIGMVANKAIHNGIEKWDEKTATLVFFAGAGGYAGANKYANDTGFAISGDWVLEPISGKANDWGIPCSYSQGWQCSGGVPGGTPAHELGHAFGLPHPGSQYASQTIMEWHGNYPTIGFIPQEIESLQASPFFNPLPEASPSPSPQVSEVASDKFDRADNSVLGQTDTGQPWEILKGSFGINNNQAYSTAGCPAPGYAVIDTGFSDGVYQIKLATNQQDLRIPFRVIDLNNMYWIETKGGNAYNINKLVNGAGSSLGELSGITAQNGDLLKIVVKGSQISVFVNGVLSSEITDSSVNGTKYGVGLWCNGAVRFDDLSFSKFEAPSPSPSATPSPSPSPSVSVSPSPSPSPSALIGSIIKIYAAGQPANNIYPNMKLQIFSNGRWRDAATYNSVRGDFTNRVFEEYLYASSFKVLPEHVRVRYLNEYRNLSQGKDRNLMVDKITIDGVEYQSEAPTVYSTGSWNANNQCKDGYQNSEWLKCEGYFQYKK